MILAGTGHRPEKLFSYDAYSDENFSFLSDFVRKVVQELSEVNNIEFIISGGALGFDQALAVAAHRLGLAYKLYIPCWGYDFAWPEKSKRKLQELIRDASEVRYMNESKWGPGFIQLRNQAMVDDSDCVLALYSGEKSGTRNTVEYANRKKKDVINKWPDWLRACETRAIIDKSRS